MSESILERYRKQLETDKINEDNELPINGYNTDDKNFDKEAYKQCLNELRNNELSIEKSYENAMKKIIKLTETELDIRNSLKASEISKVEVKHAYCPNCGKELINRYPPMFNPFTHEKQCIHECECGMKYNLEYSYPRIVFYDETDNEIMAHCE